MLTKEELWAYFQNDTFAIDAVGITVDEVQAELASRHIIDHKVKQEKMTK